MHSTQDGAACSQVTDPEQFLDRNYLLGLTPPPEMRNTSQALRLTNTRDR